MKRKKISGVENPLLHIAQGLMVDKDNEEVWEQAPVDIVEFVESKKFLNQKWNGRRGCRPFILDVLINMVKPEVREIMLLLGKGSGKDFCSSIMHLYGIYKCLCMFNPQSYYGLAPSPIYFVNTARNDTQAKKVFFTQFKALLVECPWFQGKYSEPGVQNVSFIKNIEALSANSQAYGWLGYNTIQWVGDELAFFLENDGDDESESRAQECWEAAFGSCKTRFLNDYKMIGITTPRYDDDFVMTKFEELKNRKDAYTKQAATWDVNPGITILDFAHEMKRDERRTMRDFGARPSGVLESFWPEPEILNTLVSPICKDCPIFQARKENNNIFACYEYKDCKANGYMGNGYFREWLKPPEEYNEFWMHFDLAKSKDRIGFCLGHGNGETKIEMDAYKLKMKMAKESDVWAEDNKKDPDKTVTLPLIRIPVIGFISAKGNHDPRMLQNGEYKYSAIIDYIIMKLAKIGFNIVGITFDQFQSVFIKQALEDKGFFTDLISLDRTDEIPVAAKYSLLEGRVDFPFSALLMEEAKYLKQFGRKVDHTKKNSKDVWDSLAGTIYNVEHNYGGLGTFVGMEQDYED